MGHDNLPLERAGQLFGFNWRVVACRAPKRGEIIYLANYDRLIRCPEDRTVMCSVICELTRVDVPLVRAANPGTIELTNEKIGEILDSEDAGTP